MRAYWLPLLGLLLSGCSTLDYYAHLGQGQWQLLQARQPVERLLADPHIDPALAQRLALAQRARDFASAELGLPDNRSYRLYADLGRPFVVWNVFATPAYSLEPQLHCFPIAGCVAYRGYYQQGRARGAAALLQQQGLDTYVGGVEAYSTLGWFDDPLLNTMLRWSAERMVAVIFHELAHQRLYVADDTAFNESYATFVEQQGLRQWRAANGQPPSDPQADPQRRQFIALVLATRAELQALYARDLPAAAMEQGKQQVFARLRQDYRQLRDQHWGGIGRYDAWIEGPLNNAKLLPFGLYDRWVDAFAALFAQVDGDWARFYQAVEALGQLPAPQRTDALQRLNSEPAARVQTEAIAPT
ncbi:MAG: aminopeptidase [Gammaproteobacteria bacterium]|nr:aminopeptidase [Gammaproteobacteria bacterium]MBU1490644.1 aminopeptidase [Gammaproteobacteria bacterium]MBU2066281.1 aminopeptidase [Gammaproteobacteria bacterium]MBU2139821.1 aminopeptidase [Gammaproteobacteria bacterium]MBU2218295.1 aminopeptidase [Gammaproteobacteria bacterium]